MHLSWIYRPCRRSLYTGILSRLHIKRLGRTVAGLLPFHLIKRHLDNVHFHKIYNCLLVYHILLLKLSAAYPAHNINNTCRHALLLYQVHKGTCCHPGLQGHLFYCKLPLHTSSHLDYPPALTSIHSLPGRKHHH